MVVRQFLWFDDCYTKYHKEPQRITKLIFWVSDTYQTLCVPFYFTL